MRVMIALAALAAVTAAPVFAQVAAAPVDQKAVKKPDADKIVCKTDDYTGSLIPRRICKTKGEWEQGAYDAKGALDQRRLPVDQASLCGACGH